VGESRALPDVAEEDIVGEFGQLLREIVHQSLGSGRPLSLILNTLNRERRLTLLLDADFFQAIDSLAYCLFQSR
jgi:hypothetical protein